MKTLIFNGSPRRNGNTANLLGRLLTGAKGEVKKVDAFNAHINPCIDCRYCWENRRCPFQDDMQDVYDYIEQCDNIVIASPVYFTELTGPLLSVLSRIQAFWCAKHFRNENPLQKPKKGGIILTGGSGSSMERAAKTASILLGEMNAEVVGAVFAGNTDTSDPLNNESIMQQVSELAQKMNL